MLIREFFANLADELNRECERTTNYSMHKHGKQWSSDHFKIYDDGKSFYHDSQGCGNHWGNPCNKCDKIIELYKEDFSEIFCKNSDKIDELLEKVDNLTKVIEKLQEENSKILQMLTEYIKNVNSK